MIAGRDLPATSEALSILVTGAGGFVGRHMIAHLLDCARNTTGPKQPGIQIAATINPWRGVPTGSLQGDEAFWGSEFVRRNVTVYPLDVRDEAATATLMAQVQPHQVYHLAARASGGDKDREGVFAVNVAGAANVLKAARSVSPMPRVLLASTGYVYGNTDPLRPAREEDPLAPPGRYGVYTDSKIAMEEYARVLPEIALVARAFGHTGPWQAPIFAIPSFARQLARIEVGLESPEILVGNLDVYRDLMDVRDVVVAYYLFMNQGAPGHTVNVALGRPLSMRIILDQLCALSTVPVAVVADPARYRKADIPCSTGNPSALYNLTAWQPRYTLAETLAFTMDYWREQVRAGG